MLFIFIKSSICFFLGAIFGNILTTFFFRIPRNIPINGIQQPPMCSSCGIKIKYPYYAPFFQAILKGLKCFSCGAKIPIIYTAIEALSGIFCVIYFSIFKLESFYIIKFLSVLIFGLISLLHYKTSKFYEKLNWLFLTLSLCLLSFNLNFKSIVLSEFFFELLFNSDSSNKDILELLVWKIMFAIPLLLMLKTTKVLDILEICLIIILSIALPFESFFVSGVLYFILNVISQLSKSSFEKFPFIKFLQLTPFLFALIIN
jgi:hypothetical protein